MSQVILKGAKIRILELAEGLLQFPPPSNEWQLKKMTEIGTAKRLPRSSRACTVQPIYNKLPIKQMHLAKHSGLLCGPFSFRRSRTKEINRGNSHRGSLSSTAELEAMAVTRKEVEWLNYLAN